jgi:predicted RNA-binding Zn-ribbon protein involved in translation (DUF1610 family)
MSDSIVRATCPTCGDVVLTTTELGLHVDEETSLFLFTCPRCHRHVSHDVPAGIVHILQSAGVHPVASLPELISPDDLHDFLADFDRIDCVDELRRLIA